MDIVDSNLYSFRSNLRKGGKEREGGRGEETQRRRDAEEKREEINRRGSNFVSQLAIYFPN